jgi:hypothetical protein
MTKRWDRIRFTCSNCQQIAYAKPTALLACGQCCILMTPPVQLPEGFPEHPRACLTANTPTVDPDAVPLEQRSLSPKLRSYLLRVVGLGGRLPWLAPSEQPPVRG